MSLNNLGILARDGEQYPRAEALYQESLQICREIGDEQGIASALVNLGEVAHLRGDQPRAIELIAQGLQLYHRLGDKQRLAFAIEDLAAATGALGNSERAAQLWGAAMALREQIGAPLAAVDSAEYAVFLAGLRTALGEPAFAEARRQGAALSLDQLCATAATAPPSGGC
jgi:tetratricopeptide (TPR) repeat protein